MASSSFLGPNTKSINNRYSTWSAFLLFLCSVVRIEIIRTDRQIVAENIFLFGVLLLSAALAVTYFRTFDPPRAFGLATGLFRSSSFRTSRLARRALGNVGFLLLKFVGEYSSQQ